MLNWLIEWSLLGRRGRLVWSCNWLLGLFWFLLWMNIWVVTLYLLLRILLTRWRSLGLPLNLGLPLSIHLYLFIISLLLQLVLTLPLFLFFSFLFNLHLFFFLLLLLFRRVCFLRDYGFDILFQRLLRVMLNFNLISIFTISFTIKSFKSCQFLIISASIVGSSIQIHLLFRLR